MRFSESSSQAGETVDRLPTLNGLQQKKMAYLNLYPSKALQLIVYSKLKSTSNYPIWVKKY
jgi:hypothetical protein